MNCYKVYCEAWKSYINYFSSIEKIKEILPHDGHFFSEISVKLRIIKPGYEIQSWEQFNALRIVVRVTDELDIQISMPSLNLVKYHYTEDPEVKVEGQPYQPKKSVKTGETVYTLTEDDFVTVGYVTEIPLDQPVGE